MRYTCLFFRCLVSAAAMLSLVLLAVTAPATAAGPLPILPGGHQGFGMETPAGSGRHLPVPQTRVIKVTSLNTDGPGSLREALQAEGPRVVVFEVAGNIDFTPYGSIGIKHPYLTVAGQTAPSPGITLKGCQLHINTHDVLIQHLRIRVGDLLDPTHPEVDAKSGWSQWSERDTMKVGGERIVIDHCSFSWATDENVQSRARDVTFRQCIFSECLNSPKHHKGAHSKGLLILDQSPPDRVIPESERESRGVAIIGNLFAHNADRNPMASGGATLAIINNYIYDARSKPGCGMTLVNPPRRGSRGGPILASVQGNCFDRVPAPIRFIATGDEPGKVFFDDMLVSFSPGERPGYEALIQKTTDQRQFQDHLAGEQQPQPSETGVVTVRIDDPWTASHMLFFKTWMDRPIYPEKCKATRPPIVVKGLEIKPAEETAAWVLAGAGARPKDRDSVDARVVEQVRSRTGEILKSQDDVGGWPDLPERRRKLIVPSNPSSDDDGDGYTNLEEWLHGFAAEVE